MGLAEFKGFIDPGSTEERLLEQIDWNRLPRHVAVIMDGNGRWASQRHLPRVGGHKAGIDSVRAIVEASARLDIEVLTLYAFSTENWKRPALEINTLMTLLRQYVRGELENIHRNRIRFLTIGLTSELQPAVQRELEHAIAYTSANSGMKLVVALNYSGRSEIVHAVSKLLRAAPDRVDEKTIEEHLYTRGLPDPDLLIRTSGEMRISNFLLWQIAYSEIYVTETLWPDFRMRHLLEAVVDFQRRERRYGGIQVEQPT
ncbi:MAG: isoprenyl transferase [Acidobacteriota bacterium]